MPVTRAEALFILSSSFAGLKSGASTAGVAATLIVERSKEQIVGDYSNIVGGHGNS